MQGLVVIGGNNNSNGNNDDDDNNNNNKKNKTLQPLFAKEMTTSFNQALEPVGAG